LKVVSAANVGVEIWLVVLLVATSVPSHWLLVSKPSPLVFTLKRLGRLVSVVAVTLPLRLIVSPLSRVVDSKVPGPAGKRHRYLLVLPPGSVAAELWVDGVRHYAGYSGLQEYRYYRGPEVSAARYRSARGAGVFWGFQFEIG